jgi:hypothetical protein
MKQFISILTAMMVATTTAAFATSSLHAEEGAVALTRLARAAGMSIEAFQKLEGTMTKLGIPQREAQEGNVGFGDWLMRWKERQPSAINQISSGTPLNTEAYARGLDQMSTDEAERTLIGRILRSNNSVAMKVRLLRAYSLPEGLATSTYEEFKKANEEAITGVTAKGAERTKVVPHGRGTDTCNYFLDSRDKGSHKDQEYYQWFLGYATALNMWASEHGKVFNIETVTQKDHVNHLIGYCRNHPGNLVLEAAGELYRTLSGSDGTSQKGQ